MDNHISRNDLEKLLERLLIQKRRFMRAATKAKQGPNYGSRPYLHHDLDYYLVIARRLYRAIQSLSSENSKAANIKGKKKYSGLYKKIKIRDHVEHPPKDWSDFPNITPGSNIKAVHAIGINKDRIFVRSGGEVWDMSEDHKLLVSLIKEVIESISRFPRR